MVNYTKFMLKKDRVKLLTIVGGLIGLLIIVFLCFRFFTPFGAIVSYQFNSILNSDKLSKLKGAEETSSFKPGENGVLQIPQQTIRQNVVTFNLKLITKPIEGVWVNLKFKGSPKEIKIGVRGSAKEKYQYLPLYHQVLNSLTWNQTTEGQTTFWQRERKYQDLAGLVSKPPVSDDTKVASYFFNLGDFSLSQKKVSSPSEKNTIFTRTLRGAHILFIQVDRKPLNITIEKQDFNAYIGEDVLLIELYKDDKQTIKKEIPDDGVSEANNLKMKPQTEQIQIDNLEPGVYKLVLSDKSQRMDFLITKVETNQSALVSSSPLYILDDRPATIWTNSKKITVSTWHEYSMQTVKLDNLYNLKIDKINKDFEFNLSKPETTDNTRVLHQLDIPKNDLIISGDGYFAFSQESFFDPEPIKTVDLSKVTDLNNIDYIIGNYQLAKKDGEWYTAQAYFDSKDIIIDGDNLYFSLESPELNSYGGEIVIDSLEVTVKKPGWFSKPEPAKESLAATVQKQNILQKAQEWLGAKWNQLTNWASNAWQKVFKKKPTEEANKEEPKTDDKGIITINKPTATPSPSTSSKPSPLPSPSPTQKITNFVRILNGGAGQGGAGEFAKVLLGAGFTNVTAETADKTDYKNAIIKYKQEDEKVAAKLEELLKKDYKIIDMQKIATTSAEIVVIIGEK